TRRIEGALRPVLVTGSHRMGLTCARRGSARRHGRALPRAERKWIMLASFYAAGLAFALVLPVALHRWLLELPWSAWMLVRNEREARARSSGSGRRASSSRHISGPRRLWAMGSTRAAVIVLVLLGTPRRADAVEAMLDEYDPAMQTIETGKDTATNVALV